MQPDKLNKVIPIQEWRSSSPPICAIEEEVEVLGAILLDPGAIDRVSDFLKPEHFYSGAHGKIYAAALSLSAEGISVDLMSVLGRLRDRGYLEQVGGQSRLMQLLSGTVSSVSIEYFAQRVAAAYKRRRLQQGLSEVIEAISDSTLAESDLAEMTEKVLYSLTEQQPKGLTAIADFLESEFLRIEQIEAGVQTVGLATGFYDFDAMTQGLKPGNLWILAGRPSMGKSAMAANILRHVAGNGHPVALFSLEMDGGQIARRLLSAESGVVSGEIGSGNIQPASWEAISQAHAKLAQLPIYIDDRQSVGMSDIRNQCRRMKSIHGLSLIVIDYLHLMLDGPEDEVSALGQITRACKKLARELRCPIILLSQLSREVEKRGANKRPMMSDLRSSGAIEQDADGIVFVYREEYYDPQTSDQGIAELIVSKHRDGPTGTVKLLFENQFSQFRNLAIRNP